MEGDGYERGEGSDVMCRDGVVEDCCAIQLQY